MKKMLRRNREVSASMKIQRQRNRKLNNAGMSLIEIIVAMFILATVTVTVISIYVYSVRLNARSRTQQQTTAAAQTVMENFKAYSVQEIGGQFATGSFAGNNAVTLEMIDPANPGVLLAAPVSGGDTNFRIHDLKYQNEYYDVEVQLRSHSVNGHTADMETLIYENRTVENSAAYVGYASMDADALSQIAEQVAELWTNEEAAAPAPDPSASPEPSATPAPAITHTGSEVDLSQIKITKRVITVTMEMDVDGYYVAKVGCVYTYGGNDYQYGVTETGTPKKFHIDSTDYTFDLDADESGDTKEIFKQATPLENLTLYYYPAYSYRAAVNIDSDEIRVINNFSGTPEVKCYIYKQRNLAISDVKISQSELHYNLDLNLGTNVNIYDDNLDTVLGSPTSTHNYDETGSMTNRYHGIGYAAKNMDYPNPAATPSPAMPSGISSQTVENLRIMYDITISVYKQGDLPDDYSVPTPYPQALNVLKSTIIE